MKHYKVYLALICILSVIPFTLLIGNLTTPQLTTNVGSDQVWIPPAEEIEEENITIVPEVIRPEANYTTITHEDASFEWGYEQEFDTMKYSIVNEIGTRPSEITFWAIHLCNTGVETDGTRWTMEYDNTNSTIEIWSSDINWDNMNLELTINAVTLQSIDSMCLRVYGDVVYFAFILNTGAIHWYDNSAGFAGATFTPTNPSTGIDIFEINAKRYVVFLESVLGDYVIREWKTVTEARDSAANYSLGVRGYYDPETDKYHYAVSADVGTTYQIRTWDGTTFESVGEARAYTFGRNADMDSNHLILKNRAYMFLGSIQWQYVDPRDGTISEFTTTAGGMLPIWTDEQEIQYFIGTDSRVSFVTPNGGIVYYYGTHGVNTIGGGSHGYYVAGTKIYQITTASINVSEGFVAYGYEKGVRCEFITNRESDFKNRSYMDIYLDSDVHVCGGWIDENLLGARTSRVIIRSLINAELERDINVRYYRSTITEILKDVIDRYCIFLNYGAATIAVTTDVYDIEFSGNLKDVFKWADRMESHMTLYNTQGQITYDDPTGSGKSYASGDGTLSNAIIKFNTANIKEVFLYGADGNVAHEYDESDTSSSTYIDHIPDEWDITRLSTLAKNIIAAGKENVTQAQIQLIAQSLLQFGETLTFEYSPEGVASDTFYIVESSVQLSSGIGVCTIESALVYKSKGMTNPILLSKTKRIVEGKDKLLGAHIDSDGDFTVHKGILGKDFIAGEDITDYGWTDSGAITGLFSIISTIGSHKLPIYLNKAAGAVGAVSLRYAVTAATSGNYECWVRMNDIALANGPLISFLAAGVQVANIYTVSANLYAHNAIRITGAIASNTWYHFRIEMVSITEIKYWFNGRLIYTATSLLAGANFDSLDISASSGAAIGLMYFNAPAYSANGYSAFTNYNDGLIKAEGLVVKDARVDQFHARYQDLVTPVSTGKLPGANFPNWETYTANTRAYAFGLNEYIDISPPEILHGYVAGSDLEAHVHFALNAIPAANQTVKFTLYYTWTEAGGVASESSLTAEYAVPIATADLTNLYLSLGTISGVGKTFGGIMTLTIKRVASTGTELVGEPFVLAVGIHYLAEHIGSEEHRGL